MSNKNQNGIDIALEKFYYFLKNKLKFDDVQATALILSLILIPLSLFLGFFYTKIETFQLVFYITLFADALVVLYSVIKFKYFKNKRINFIKEFEHKTIEVKSVEDLDELNPLEFECFVREMFIKQGFRAWTTKRSHDKGVDVVAEKGTERFVIQVKYSSKSVNGDAIFQVNYGKTDYKANKAIVVTNSKFTDRAILYAKQYKVDLIDEGNISRFLRNNPSIKFTYKNNS